ncbi:hypothetical protein VP01_4647g2 [Puccinia sorghi]|uniref:Uncharacterized protein n=1 Tax=Puccinia sorghi TaxID=27349 RepID=A0A0L6UQ91_9BASI|nr:hypothetical protein VP01_4647g2 [Puccinia sorghi]
MCLLTRIDIDCANPRRYIRKVVVAPIAFPTPLLFLVFPTRRTTTVSSICLPLRLCSRLFSKIISVHTRRAPPSCYLLLVSITESLRMTISSGLETSLSSVVQSNGPLAFQKARNRALFPGLDTRSPPTLQINSELTWAMSLRIFWAVHRYTPRYTPGVLTMSARSRQITTHPATSAMVFPKSPICRANIAAGHLGCISPVINIAWCLIVQVPWSGMVQGINMVKYGRGDGLLLFRLCLITWSRQGAENTTDGGFAIVALLVLLHANCPLCIRGFQFETPHIEAGKSGEILQAIQEGFFVHDGLWRQGRSSHSLHAPLPHSTHLYNIPKYISCNTPSINLADGKWELEVKGKRKCGGQAGLHVLDLNLIPSVSHRVPSHICSQKFGLKHLACWLHETCISVSKRGLGSQPPRIGSATPKCCDQHLGVAAMLPGGLKYVAIPKDLFHEFLGVAPPIPHFGMGVAPPIRKPATPGSPGVAAPISCSSFY